MVLHVAEGTGIALVLGGGRSRFGGRGGLNEVGSSSRGLSVVLFDSTGVLEVLERDLLAHE